MFIPVFQRLFLIILVKYIISVKYRKSKPCELDNDEHWPRLILLCFTDAAEFRHRDTSPQLNHYHNRDNMANSFGLSLAHRPSYASCTSKVKLYVSAG